jgi:phasin family protein
MSRSFQQVGQLNMQLSQTLFEEAANVGQRLLTTDRPTEAMSAAAARAQPAADKLRAYQQHLGEIASATQVELTRVTEQHVQETSRTARALAEDVTRVAAEETNKSLRQQEETVKNFRDPFQSEQSETRMEADGQAGKVSAQGNMQGNPARQPVTKAPSQAR